MANETTKRSYREFDAYERDGLREAAPRRAKDDDPLAELARIIGQDDGFADFLRHGASSAVAAPPALAASPATAPDEILDVPRMSLRGPAGADADGVDWDQLEAELAAFAADRGGMPGAAGGPVEEAEGGADQEIESWREAAIEAEPQYSAEDEYGAGRAAPDDIGLREAYPASERAVEPHYAGGHYSGSDNAAEQDVRLSAGALAAGAGAVAAGAAVAAWRLGPNRGEARAAAQGQAAPEPVASRAADLGYAAPEAMPAHSAGVEALEQAPPRRRRAGMTAIAAVVGIALVGGSGVLAYRGLTGGAAPSGEARVVRANPEPIRAPAPQASADSKPVTDRVPGGDRVVGREERPLAPREQAAQVQPAPNVAPRVIPLPAAPASGLAPVEPVRPVQAAPAATAASVDAVQVSPGAAQTLPAGVQASPVAAQTSTATAQASPAAAPTQVGVPQPRPNAADEPRRVRTVSVTPDGQLATTPRPAPPGGLPLSVVPGQATSQPAQPAARVVARPLDGPPASEPAAPAARPVVTSMVTPRASEPAPDRRPVAQRSAAAEPDRPIDLAPTRTATVRPAQAAQPTGGGQSFVQISSHQSESEARSAFVSAQRRFSMLQGYTPNIRSVEIPDRGTWHRLRVGPFSRAEAASFCERLRGAGGNCVVN